MESIRGKITRRLPDSQGLRRFVLVADKSAKDQTPETSFDFLIGEIDQGDLPEAGAIVTLIGHRLSPLHFLVHEITQDHSGAKAFTR